MGGPSPTTSRSARAIDAFEAGQRALLERMARGASLASLLEGVMLLIESQATNMQCSILMLDREHSCLRAGAAPSLPVEYNRALDGAKIGPNAGSCGAAASRGETVIVEDVETHPYWVDYKHLVLPHGLRACWSSPVRRPWKLTERRRPPDAVKFSGAPSSKYVLVAFGLSVEQRQPDPTPLRVHHTA